MNSYYHNKMYASLILLALYVLLVVPVVFANQSIETTNKASLKGKTTTEVLTGAISQNELTDNLERLGIKCIIHAAAGSTALSTLSIESVRLGSSAYYGGILAGDTIKDLYRLNANTFRLTIERSGKIYQANLQMISGQIGDNLLNVGTKKDLLNGNVNHQDLSGSTGLKSANAKLGADESILIGNAQKTTLDGAAKNWSIPGSVNKQDDGSKKKLIPYDIELIIDITGSMAWVDGTGDLSKFQWCHEQVRNLAQKLDPYHKTFTITTFNTAHTTMESCNPAKVEQIYGTIEPSGNTDLVDPLEDRLNSALIKHTNSGHPVLIVVITDGLPNVPKDPNVVNRALIDFTHQLNDPDEMTVTILQIGDTFEGRDFCTDLDDNLINEGAKYDIVDTKTFAELKQEGLVEAMIDAVVESRSDHHLSKSEKDFKRFVNSLPPSRQTSSKLDAQLKEREKERQEIEKQILGQ